MKGTLSWGKLVAHDIEIKEKLEKSKKKRKFWQKGRLPDVPICVNIMVLNRL